ncbi:MAG: hypothetical protein WDN30_14965 [Pararobbsia sp.]
MDFDLFTINDFILLIPMALAGALFLGAIPVRSKLRINTLRVLGAAIGALCGILLVEALPAML